MTENVNEDLIGLTFIGTSNYSETKYQYINTIIQTNLFPKAFEQFFTFKKLFIVATEEAEKKHIRNCNCNTPVELIKIPEGRNENELWNIFEIISKAIPDKSNLVVDVTHGFRSLPIVVLAVLLYLKTVKNINIDKVIYGAFEAKIEDVSPVFDLTPFLNIIDWSYSVNDFVNYGNSSRLKNILEAVHKSTYLNKKKWKSQNLYGLGNSLSNLSDALSITRIEESIVIANKLNKKLRNVTNDIIHLPNAKPLEPLLGMINSKFENLLLDPSELFQKAGFRAQIKMIEDYLNNCQYMQAITLSREILVSKLCVLLDFHPISERDKAERILNNIDTSNQTDLVNDNIQSIEDFRNIWDNVKDIRNDINHAGMKKSSTKTLKAIQNIKNYSQKTIELIKKYE